MNQPLACNLNQFDDAAMRRYDVVAARVREAVAVDQVPGGFAFRYPADPELILELAEFITLERQCCPFFDFTLRLGAGADQVELALTGGPDVEAFLETVIEERRRQLA